jgi:hypothetical protein
VIDNSKDGQCHPHNILKMELPILRKEEDVK